MVDAHPGLKAVSPPAPIADWFLGDDWHHNGALYLPSVFGFYRVFGDPREHPETKVPPPSFDVPETGYQFYLDMGAISAVNDKFFHSTVRFWNQAIQHGAYDPWWQARSTLPHLKDIKPAVLVT